MTLRHLPTMLSLSAIKFKRHKSSRYLPEFNATTNALIASLKVQKQMGGVKG